MTNIEEQILANQQVIMSVMHNALRLSTDDAKQLVQHILASQRLINENENHEF